MGEAVYQHHHKFSYIVQSVCPHVQDAIVSIEVEGVAVEVACKLLIRWYSISQQDCDWCMLTACCNCTSDVAAEFVNDKGSRIQRVDIQGRKVLVRCPLSILLIDVIIC